MHRFTIPVVGQPSSVRFPHVERRALATGLRLSAVQHSAVPVVTMVCLVDAGTAVDPKEQPGLASLVTSLVTEGAGSYDSIEIAEVVAKLGGHLAAEVGADTATVTLTVLARHFAAGLELLSDVVRRPRLAEADFDRVRELRFSRLKQLARVPGTAADRILLNAVYGDHPYGHGALGTTRSVERISLDDVTACWRRHWQPGTGALLIAGDVPPERALERSGVVFGDWVSPGGGLPQVAQPPLSPAVELRVVHWPGAAQSEIRVGHPGPARRSGGYHALTTLNALLGGQFTSRINRNLRETRAITYGARSSFDMRRAGGVFSCDASVQTDATAVALSEILREMRDVCVDGSVSAAELEQAKAALTRGYVKHFETAGHLARAMAELSIYALPEDSFDRFVPEIDRLTPDDMAQAARSALHPDQASLVVVGDVTQIRPSLEALGHPVIDVAPEF